MKQAGLFGVRFAIIAMREYQEDVDRVFHAANTVLTADEVLRL
jgi:hypothetical protein